MCVVDSRHVPLSLFARLFMYRRGGTAGECAITPCKTRRIRNGKPSPHLTNLPASSACLQYRHQDNLWHWSNKNKSSQTDTSNGMTSESLCRHSAKKQWHKTNKITNTCNQKRYPVGHRRSKYTSKRGDRTTAVKTVNKQLLPPCWISCITWLAVEYLNRGSGYVG